MENFYKQILTELYQLDPGLRQYENQLISLMKELIKSKPDVKLDENFRQLLKSQLLSKAADIKTNKKLSYNYMFKFSFLKFARSFSYVAVGVAVMALAISSSFYLTSPKNRVAGTKLALNSQFNIIGVADKAFGALQTQNTGSPAGAEGLGAGGMGEGTIAVRSEIASDAVTTGDIVDASVEPGYGGGGMIMPAPVYISYVYRGEPLELNEDRIGVLKRIKNSASASQLGSLLTNVDFGLMNFGKFSNVQLQNLSFVEDREFGYAIYANLYDSSISVSENYFKWPNPMSQCQDDACYRSFQLNINDMLPDDEVIRLANEFIINYGINLTSYGEPTINNDWRIWYDRAEDKQDVYIPEVVSVVYPLKLQDKEVYDESGNKTGLYVNVNVRHKRAAGVWNLFAQSYEQSMYEGETDVDSILKYAQSGGLYSWQWEDAPNRVEVGLGTPNLSYVRIWNYKPGAAEGDELYIPALIFPILDSPENVDVYRKAVVVPLAKDLLSPNVWGGPIRIMEEIQ
jgi:hypothetical protein